MGGLAALDLARGRERIRRCPARADPEWRALHGRGCRESAAETQAPESHQTAGRCRGARRRHGNVRIHGVGHAETHRPMATLTRRREHLEQRRRGHLHDAHDHERELALRRLEIPSGLHKHAGTGDEQRRDSDGPETAPSITQQPSSQAVSTGETATFTAASLRQTDADGAVGTVNRRRRHVERDP